MLSLPLRVLLFWFVVNFVDTITEVKLAEAFTLNGSLLFGLVLVSVATAAMEEIAGWTKRRFFVRSQRAVDDA